MSLDSEWILWGSQRPVNSREESTEERTTETLTSNTESPSTETLTQSYSPNARNNPNVNYNLGNDQRNCWSAREIITIIMIKDKEVEADQDD